MKCKYCGADVKREEKICPYCDSEIDHPVEQSQQPIIIQNIITNETPSNYYSNNVNRTTGATYSSKNKMITLLLCVLFGYTGIHHFYVGKVGMGILYLFTFGLFYCGWIYDIVKIASGTFKDATGQVIK